MLLHSIANLISSIVDVYMLMIVIYVLLSWIPYKSGVIADIDAVLAKLCDPYLNLFKRCIPPIGGMIDVSPIVAIIALQLLVRIVYIII